MNVYLPNKRLPSEYQEVEYIESSGTQYINTGYIPSNSTKLTMSMGGWSALQQFQTLFGARYNWSSTGKGFVLGYNTSYMYYAMFDYALDISTSSLSFINGNNHIIEMSQNGVYEDGSLKQSLNTRTFTSPVNLTLFAMNDNGTVKEQGAFKMYYTKIWDNGTLVRDFVPCYRKSDSVIGLYDLVNSAFYTNQGTGTFSKGNDVTMAELKNAYIGEVYEYDFTTGTHGWTADSSAGKQNSNGLYANGLVTNVFWSAPSAIYSGVPKKITINYNKTGTDNGTGIYTASPEAWYYLPRGKSSGSLQNRFDWEVNGTITQNTISNPTGLCSWELDIDTSTTNWTITHKITGVNNIVESSGAFKTIWDSGALQLRTVNWDSGNPGIYIRSILFEY